jgi:hypothetical protein
MVAVFGAKFKQLQPEESCAAWKTLRADGTTSLFSSCAGLVANVTSLESPRSRLVGPTLQNSALVLLVAVDVVTVLLSWISSRSNWKRGDCLSYMAVGVGPVIVNVLETVAGIAR